MCLPLSVHFIMWFPFIFFEALFLQRVSESSLLCRQGPLNRGASVEFLTSKVQSVQAESCITIFAWPLSCALEGRRWFSLPFPLVHRQFNSAVHSPSICLMLYPPMGMSSSEFSWLSLTWFTLPEGDIFLRGFPSLFQATGGS